MTAPSPCVTASVVSHGHGALIDLLLSDLMCHAPPALAHLVVTLNIPESWAPRTLLNSVRMTIIRNEAPKGFAANHNQAFEACDTPVFAILNPDLRLPEDPFPALTRAIDRNGCGLAVPWQVDGQGMLEDFRRRLPTPTALVRRAWAAQRGAGRPMTPTSELDWVAGAFMALRSDAFRQIGGFDERYRLYCEDVDLCLRLQLAGWRIHVLEEVKVVHDARRDSGRTWQHLRWHLGSFARLWTSRAFWAYRVQRLRLHEG